MKYALTMTACWIGFLAIKIAPVSAQAPSVVNATPSSKAERLVCSAELIEVDLLGLRNRGIDFVLPKSPAEMLIRLEDVDSFRSTVKTLAKNGFVETVMSPSLILTSGQTGTIKTTIENREYELSLTPRVVENGLMTDIAFQHVQPDASRNGARRTRTMELCYQGKLNESVAIDVTKLFTDTILGKNMVLVLNFEQKTRAASESE